MCTDGCAVELVHVFIRVHDIGSVSSSMKIDFRSRH